MIQHLRKLISIFYKDHPNKLIIILKVIDITIPMAKTIIKLTVKLTKQKQG